MAYNSFKRVSTKTLEAMARDIRAEIDQVCSALMEGGIDGPALDYAADDLVQREFAIEAEINRRRIADSALEFLQARTEAEAEEALARAEKELFPTLEYLWQSLVAEMSENRLPIDYEKATDWLFMRMDKSERITEDDLPF